jgi:GMP synthase (glutamine-hydrolysing)
VKPFLLLAIRAEDAAADNEYASFLALTGRGECDLRRALGNVDLRDSSGIFLAGEPFNSSDPERSNRRYGGEPRQTRMDCSMEWSARTSRF